MKRICAWCKKELHGVNSQAGTENVITHGICRNCRDNILFQLGVELELFLDSLDVPIVLVNREGTVVTVNNQAKTMLCKDLPEIEGYKGGEVFECAYARLPEGCGNTTHCSGCTIRRTVMQTYETGKSFLRVPATLNRNTPEDSEKMNLLISTERLAELVLLRIDKLEANDAAQQTAERDR
jgi:transcriptional regulator with PAS, ATPase and Fis domain